MHETATAATASHVDPDSLEGNKKEAAAAINTAVLRSVSAHTCWSENRRTVASTLVSNKRKLPKHIQRTVQALHMFKLTRSE